MAGRIRLRVVAAAVLISAAAALILLPLLLGGLFMAALTAPVCGPEDDPAGANLAYETVSFPLGETGLTTPAFYVLPPEPNGGTILFMPTGAARRGVGMGTIALYAYAGYAVLTFDSSICVSGQANSLGARESLQAEDALAYLLGRPETDPDRVAVHGFSAGGAAAVLAAARLPQIAALVAVGGYANFVGQIDADAPANLGLLAPLFRLGAQTAYAASTGLDWNALDPLGASGAIAPRSALFMYGELEPAIEGGRAMAARSGGQFVMIPGVGHGGYLATPESAAAYRAGLVDFLARAIPARP